MKRTGFVMLAVLLVAVAAAQDFGGGARQPGVGDYAAETGGALLGGVLVGAGATAVLGFAGAVVASSANPYDDWAGLGGLVIGGAAGAALGYPFGCGLGTTLAGGALDAEGNAVAAYGSAYAGLALGALAGLATRRWEVAIPAMVMLPPAGAVIGYNLGATRNGHQSSFGARVSPPTVAFSIRSGRDQQRHFGFDCRLVAVRF
ncbi:MAG: hypothetical protein NTX53_04215 [candidate division WOR-3 bacterium]|nr:hypothetical protein [candidate division WOR-3 bacterium]